MARVFRRALRRRRGAHASALTSGGGCSLGGGEAAPRCSMQLPLVPRTQTSVCCEPRRYAASLPPPRLPPRERAVPLTDRSAGLHVARLDTVAHAYYTRQHLAGCIRRRNRPAGRSRVDVRPLSATCDRLRVPVVAILRCSYRATVTRAAASATIGLVFLASAYSTTTARVATSSGPLVGPRIRRSPPASPSRPPVARTRQLTGASRV